jgi:hypothetical protein
MIIDQARDAGRALRIVRAMREAKDADAWRAIEARVLARLAAAAGEDPTRGPAAAIELLLEARALVPKDTRGDAAIATHADRLTYTLVTTSGPDAAVRELERLRADEHAPLADFLAFALEARAAKAAEAGKVEEAIADLSRARRCATSPELRAKLADDLVALRGRAASIAPPARTPIESTIPKRVLG